MIVAGVVVAAGASTRMGEPKALLEIGGRPMLQWVVDAVEASSLSPVMVVTGRDAEQVRARVRLGRAQWVDNPDPARGTMSSLRAGLEAAGQVAAAVKVVADQPEIDSSLIDALAGAWEPRLHDFGLVRYADGDGHPVLVASNMLADLGEGDRRVWRMMEERVDRVLRLSTTARRPVDVNTPADLEAVRSRLSEQP